MSIKIYYGLRLPFDGFGQLMPWLYNAQEVVRAKAQEVMFRRIFRYAATAIDCEDAGIEPTFPEWRNPNRKFPQMYISQARDYAERLERKHSWFALHSTLMLFPDAEGSQTLMLPFLSDELNEVFDSLGAEEYGYWNNTDPPEEISEEEFYARRGPWDRVLLSRSGIPAREGLEFELVPKNFTSTLIGVDFKEHLDLMPTLDQRIHALAQSYQPLEDLVRGGVPAELVDKARSIIKPDMTWDRLVSYPGISKSEE